MTAKVFAMGMSIRQCAQLWDQLVMLAGFQLGCDVRSLDTQALLVQALGSVRHGWKLPDVLEGTPSPQAERLPQAPLRHQLRELGRVQFARRGDDAVSGRLMRDARLLTQRDPQPAHIDLDRLAGGRRAVHSPEGGHQLFQGHTLVGIRQQRSQQPPLHRRSQRQRPGLTALYG
nr:hypothetical protein [Allorhizocola rhizosphaerae]